MPPFWTSCGPNISLKVMLQQQGVINEVFVWLGLVASDNRLEIINNQFGTIVAMTHILLPFMILPMYSVMQTIQLATLGRPSHWGNQLDSILARLFPHLFPALEQDQFALFCDWILHHPEIVGGTEGVFISNRSPIAFPSLNWGWQLHWGPFLAVVLFLLGL